MSVETILSAYMHACTHTYTHTHTHTHTHMYRYKHTGTRTHARTDCTKLNLHNLKLAADRGLRWMKKAAWNGKHGRPIVLGKEMFFSYT